MMTSLHRKHSPTALQHEPVTTVSTGRCGKGAGGKKNRQKERRLMKGFNIAPPTSSGNSAAVPENLASLQKSSSNENLTNPGSARLSGGAGLSIRRKYRDNLSKLMFSANRKRRWDSLIEVAKTGKVAKFISQSRSEDSVCEQRSPNSENQTDTDSNASAIEGKSLSMLKKKREKFQKSRYTPNESSSVDIEERCEKRVLKRASSVPVQGRPEAKAEDFKDRNGTIMPSLPPGIQPVSGHNIATGWL